MHSTETCVCVFIPVNHRVKGYTRFVGKYVARVKGYTRFVGKYVKGRRRVKGYTRFVGKYVTSKRVY